MNYFIHYRSVFILSVLSIIGSVVYILLSVLFCEEDMLLLEEPYSNAFPRTLTPFNLQKMVYWRDLPEELQYDIFGPVTQQKSNEPKEKVMLCDKPLEEKRADVSFPVCLNGWSGINEKMVFVFSLLNSNKTFIGTVGDSFENPAFTILSFDLKTIQDEMNLYSVPIVTILDKERDRLITLAPASYNHT
ncbi:MAG: hypothetical protein C5B43_04945 [Verrucomicrobia bacterium]|nr:MAG: hypothetical protein C5B43_04945 [Verrucomicrobiota bacterium]